MDAGQISALVQPDEEDGILGSSKDKRQRKMHFFRIQAPRKGGLSSLALLLTKSLWVTRAYCASLYTPLSKAAAQFAKLLRENPPYLFEIDRKRDKWLLWS